MIIKASDISRLEGQIKLPQLGGETILGTAKISMHKPTGVVFMQVMKDGAFEKYVVGLFSKQSQIEQSKEFVENTEKNFFDAVKYFEELIEKLSPKDTEMPSMGRFYFYKESLNKYCKVVIPGMTEVFIEKFDVPIVFTPPQNKPYGRLDMTAINKPQYEIISSKFALRYNEEATKQDEDYQKGMYTLSDFAVYDMTPYQNNEGKPGEEQPEEVNDKKLNPEDIEGEDVNDKKNKDKQKQEQKDKQKDKDGEQGEDEKGEKKDESKGEGEPVDEDEKKGDKGDEEGEPTDEQGEPTDEDGEPSDEEGEPTDKEGKPAQVSDKEKESKLSVHKGEYHKQLPEPKDLIPTLESLLEAKQGLKDKYKKQNRLINVLDTFSQDELKTVYNKLNLPENTSKKDFINLVTEKTQTIF